MTRRFHFTVCRLVGFLLAFVAFALSAAAGAGARPEKMKPLDAWTAVGQMTPGINIGNTFENTTRWETGWGSPIITKDYIDSLAELGFKTIRLPVAWDTYAENGRITREKFQRIDEVVGWILDAGMFCVINIHWDEGWIDSGNKERYPDTYHTFSKEAEKKFRSYWGQIARHYADKNEKLIFEAINEETNFENEGSTRKAYAALTRANQIFIDTVRRTGGNNPRRLLIIPGYKTDIEMTSLREYRLPKDSVPDRLFLSIHYYQPWPFAGMEKDESWGKMQLTWGNEKDVNELTELFDKLSETSERHKVPVFIGEFAVCAPREKESRLRWTVSVFSAALKRKMVPVLWDTGGAVSRREPYGPSEDLSVIMLRNMELPEGQ